MRTLKILLVVISLLGLNPLTAEAKTTASGGPYENLALTGQVVNLKLSGYPVGAGFYIIQCKGVNSDARPQVCNSTSQLWISNSLGADYLPTADIQFKPTATFIYGTQTINCVNTACGIFIRLDHKSSADRSEDQFIPIKFFGSTLPNPNADVIRAFVNDRQLSTINPMSVRNQTIFKIDATSRSGSTLTYSTVSTTCSLIGNQVTILQGSGYCEIDISSPGNSQYSAITNHYLFKLMPGIANLSIPTRVSPGTSLVLPVNTSFGAKISYEVSNTKNCTLSQSQNSFVLNFTKVGACTLKATAPGVTDTYAPLKQSISFKIRR